MKSDNLIFKRAKCYMQNFKEDNIYIYLGQDDNFINCGKYISEISSIETCNNNDFETDSVQNAIKNVVCIYEGDNKSLTPYETYSVYMHNTKFNYYKIVDDSYEYVNYSCDYFLNVNEFNQLKEKDNFNEILNERIAKIKNKNESLKELTRQKELVKNVLLLTKEETFSMENNFHNDNTANNLISKNTKLEKGFFIVVQLILLTNLLIQPFNLVTSTINLIFFILLTIKSLLDIKNSRSSSNNCNYELNDYSYLENLNSLPFDILGKIKFIESNLIILNTMKISEDIITLLRESVNLTVSLAQCESNDSTNKKLDTFLTNNINYIHNLKTNKHLEESYIKEQLAQNLNDVIEKNSSIFKSMVEDNQYLNKKINIK